MIMMPYGWTRPSPQVTGHADLWHPTGQRLRPAAPSPVSRDLGKSRALEALAQYGKHVEDGLASVPSQLARVCNGPIRLELAVVRDPAARSSRVSRSRKALTRIGQVQARALQRRSPQAGTCFGRRAFIERRGRQTIPKLAHGSPRGDNRDVLASSDVLVMRDVVNRFGVLLAAEIEGCHVTSLEPRARPIVRGTGVRGGLAYLATLRQCAAQSDDKQQHPQDSQCPAPSSPKEHFRYLARKGSLHAANSPQRLPACFDEANASGRGQDPPRRPGNLSI